MTVSAAHASRTAVQKHGTTLIVATVAALFMTIIGALGTGEAPLASRLAFWLICMESGALIGIGVTTGIQAWGGLGKRRMLECGLVALLIALPLTFVVISARSLLFGLPMPGSSALAWMFFYVLIVSIAMTAVQYTLDRGDGSLEPVVLAPPPTLAPVLAFSTRLPQHLRAATVLALEAEDHYLRVHTDAGSDLILMRLSDAIAELAPDAGAQTHRGWWVSRAAVGSARRGDGRAELTLTNGIVVPVSRSFYKALNGAGWFG